MALSADMDWYIRAGGDNTNSGGFDDTVVSPGSNYADQDAVQYTGANLTVHASDNTKVIPDGHTPAADDVGNVVRISTNAGGWTYGYYTITAQDGTNWTLDRSPAATGTSGGAWRMGGAFANIRALAATVAGSIAGGSGAPSVPTPLASGHRVNGRGDGSDDPTSILHDWSGTGYVTLPNGSAAQRIVWQGYNGRPLIGWSGMVAFTVSFHHLENLCFKETGQNWTNYGVFSASNPITAKRLKFDQAGYDNRQFTGTLIDQCEFLNSGSTTGGSNPAAFLAFGFPGLCCGTSFTNMRGPALATNSTYSHVLIDSLIRNCHSASIAATLASAYLVAVLQTVFDQTAGGCLSISGDSSVVCRNNVFCSSSGTALTVPGATATNDKRVELLVDYNAFYNNSANYSGISAGANDIACSSDPHTDAANGDYTLNATAGGGLELRDGGFPQTLPGLSTNVYQPIGFLGTPAAGGGLLSHGGMTGGMNG